MMFKILFHPSIKTVFLFSLLQLCSTLSLNAQIVNIEQKRIITDTTGLAGSLAINLTAARFRESFISSNIIGHIQYKTERNIFLLTGNYEVVNAGGTAFNNSAFGHFRFNRKLNETIRLEAFTQFQYNSVTKIEARYLNGLGIRLKLADYENAKFYWGIAFMNEYEVLNEPRTINKDNRLSSYFTFTLVPQSTISLRNTSYIQPNIESFEDYRFSNSTNLSFAITAHLKFTTIFEFLYDSRPPIDIPTVNYQVRNGLKYSF